jgi:hypothetical protein
MNCDGESIPEEPAQKAENDSPETPVIGGEFAFAIKEENATRIVKEEP